MTPLQRMFAGFGAALVADAFSAPLWQDHLPLALIFGLGYGLLFTNLAVLLPGEKPKPRSYR